MAESLTFLTPGTVGIILKCTKFGNRYKLVSEASLAAPHSRNRNGLAYVGFRATQE